MSPSPNDDDCVARVRRAVAVAEAAAAQAQADTHTQPQTQPQTQQHGPLAPYDRPRLVRLCLAHAQAVGAEAQFAAAFLARAGEDSGGIGSDEAAAAAVDAYADQLVFDLFLPLRAIARSSPAAEPLPADDVGPADWLPAYIFPPSPMTRVDEDGDLNESGQQAATLLGALDPGALALLRGAGPAPTVVLPPAACAAFARFDACLRPVDNENEPAAVHRLVWVGSEADATATATTTTTTNDATSAHLLALHAAVAAMLQASGAGRYVDGILAETAVEDLAAGGQTHLEQLLRLRLDGWWDGGRVVAGRDATGDDNDDDDDDDSTVWVEQSVFVEERAVPSA